MRIAVVSDIHGNLPALEAVAADFASRAVDEVVNLGDFLSGPLMPRETAGYLMSRPWYHIAGNHDRLLLGGNPGDMIPSDAYARSCLSPLVLEWLQKLPSSAVLHDRLFLCHGSPRTDSEYLLETVERGKVRAATPEEISIRLDSVAAAVVLCGHSHLPRSVRAPTGQLVVDPGSVGLQAYDDDSPEYHVIETGSPEARYALIERIGESWAVEFIAVAYDYEPVVELARRNGRPDWAFALESGHFPPANVTRKTRSSGGSPAR